MYELERLYRREFVRFVRVATAITRDADVAADVVQESFARAIKHHGDFRDEGPLEAWIWRIVLNEAKRAPTSRAVGEFATQAPAANGSSLDETAVRVLIAALPERQRLAVFLRYYADLDYRTIARVLAIETGTVSATLAAAHRSLREAIEGVRS
jgi:RNA polymerase sigma-70 factor, ECF subfamily